MKLRTAKMNKERALQLKERELLNEQERQYTQQFDAYMAAELERANAAQALEDQKRLEANLQAKLVLEEQMLEKDEALKLAQVMCFHCICRKYK